MGTQKDWIGWTGLPLLVLAWLAAGSSAHAQELVTDRPDQTESAETVAPSHVQLEVGWGASSDADGVETSAVPQALARIGLTPRLELRLGWDGWIENRPGGDGRGDGEIGAKLRLRDGAGGSAAVALLCGVTVPIGEAAVTADAWDPACRLSVAHELAAGWSLGYNVGAEWETAELAAGESTRSRLLYTVAAGRGIGERLGVFLELFGDVGGSAHGPPRHHFDGGVTYRLRDNLQLDGFAGVGLSGASDDWLVGLGVSVRLPR